MGEVWRAFDTVTERVVAIKVLPSEFGADPTFRERFRREARAAAGVDEPHVIPIHDFGEIDGRLFVSMRLIAGEDLQTLIARGPMQPHRAVNIVGQVAAALHAAHRIGLVHRDVKPSNILVGEDDFAYLIDFGIARAEGDTGLTATGGTIGTWAYMAPERFEHGTADARSDVYALTCVLHQALTGATPFPCNSLQQIAMAHMVSPPPRPSLVRADINPLFDDVIAIGMAKDPNRRYATTKDLAASAHAALAAGNSAPIRHDRPPPMPPPTPTPIPTATPTPTPMPMPTVAASPAAAAAWPAATAPRRRRNLAIGAGLTAVVAIAAIVAVVLQLIGSDGDPAADAQSPAADARSAAIRVATDKVITESGSDQPKALLSLYEDFLCPACRNFEQTFGPTISQLIDSGTIAVDYYPVAILDSARTEHYSSRAGGAAYCVADADTTPNKEAWARFHAGLFAQQPNELADEFPTDAALIELARQAGISADDVAECITSGRYVELSSQAAAANDVKFTPNLRINGDDYTPSTPDALMREIERIVG